MLIELQQLHTNLLGRIVRRLSESYATGHELGIYPEELQNLPHEGEIVAVYLYESKGHMPRVRLLLRLTGHASCRPPGALVSVPMEAYQLEAPEFPGLWERNKV